MCMKSVLALSVLASTLFSVAAYADSDSNYLLGVEGGYARQTENFITGYVNPTAAVPLTSYDNQTYMMSDELLFFGIVGGWQWRCNRTMLGIEGNVDLHSMLKSDSFLYSTITPGGTDTYVGTAWYDRGPIFGLTGRAGYFVTSGFMPYVRLGAQVSRDEANYQAFVNPDSPGFQADFISSGKEDIWGMVLGIGIELPAMIGPSTFRIEYNYTRTESIVIEDGTPPIFGTDKFRNPQTNVLKFAWVWNFVC